MGNSSIAPLVVLLFLRGRLRNCGMQLLALGGAECFCLNLCGRVHYRHVVDEHACISSSLLVGLKGR